MKKLALGAMITLMLIAALAPAVCAEPKSVMIVSCAIEGREAAINQIEPALAEVFTKEGLVVIHGLAAKNVLDDLSLTITPSNALDLNQLVAIGRAAKSDKVVGAVYDIWSRTHLFYRDGKCEISTMVVDVQSGQPILQLVGEQYQKKCQNQEALIARGATLALGSTIAAGGFPKLTHWSTRHVTAFRTWGWALAVVSMVPIESRADVQIAAVRKATKQVFGPIAEQLK